MVSKNIVAIIQARVQSTRCPGKVMREVLGKPLIGHMIDRLRNSSSLTDIVVATSVHPSNDKMCEYLVGINVKIFRGCEEDVLERFYLAAKEFGIKNIVRLTADCPLIDPYVVDSYIKEFLLKKVDFIHPDPSFAEGLDTEVFTLEALIEAYQLAHLKSEREHITQYLFNNPGKFNITKLKNKTDDSQYRITVDEELDFLVVKRIFEALYTNKNNPFGIDQIKDFLDTHSEIYKLNTSIIRNEGLNISLEEENR
jgi:spore coat polysaccharide biosynthesis protein SpsF